LYNAISDLQRPEIIPNRTNTKRGDRMVKFTMRYGDIEHIYEAETTEELLKLYKSIDSCPDDTDDKTNSEYIWVHGSADSIYEIPTLPGLVGLLNLLNGFQIANLQCKVHVTGMTKDQVMNGLQGTHKNIPKGMTII
jgi:hypothetical protein